MPAEEHTGVTRCGCDGRREGSGCGSVVGMKDKRGDVDIGAFTRRMCAGEGGKGGGRYKPS